MTPLILLILFVVTPALAQEPILVPSTATDYEAIRLTRIATAVRTTDEITVDGLLDEPAWRIPVPETGFYQRVPRPGQQAEERTEARFLYDDNNLYIGFTCFDSAPDRMVINDLREDYEFQNNDQISVSLDSLHDRSSGFNFAVNPAGAKRDGQLSNGGINQDWDGVWDAKVHRNSDGWTAEFVIPFKTLRFTQTPVQEWGVQMTRRVLRLNEEASWSPVPVRYNASRMSVAGTLRGIENIRQGRNLTVKPYAAAGTTQVRSSDRPLTLRSLTRLKDYDGGVDLKYSLTPSLTLDTTINTDFAQVEADQQQVNLSRFNVFFPEKREFFLENSATFSFGPGGNLVPFFSRRIGLSPSGTPIPIAGGARVSGQVSRYDVGVLAMRTREDGLTPANTYLVGRIKRNLRQNSWLGALVTNRDSATGGDFNRVYGADAHFQFYQKLEFDSYVLNSETPGRSGQTQARRLQSAWRDDELTINAEYNAIQPNFNPEVGFVRRGNSSMYSGEFSWRPQLNRSDSIRNLTFGTSIDYFSSGSTGEMETRVRDGTLGITFENAASATFVTTQTFDRLLTPFRIRPDISIPVGDYSYQDYRGSFRTDTSERISGNGNVTWGEFWDGSHRSYGGGLDLKPNRHLSIDLSYSRNDVSLATGRFTTDLAGVRFVYAFSPRAFLNAYFQYNADTRQVSSNIRFNITHHPLSDLYLVYNDTRDTARGEMVGRAFIVKLTHLFTF